MSRAYRIRVKESLKCDIKKADEIRTQIELLEILPAEQMGEMLAAELAKRGFERQNDGTLVRKEDGICVTVEPCSGEVTIRAEAEDTVELEVLREGFGYDDVGPASKQIKERLSKELQADLEKCAAQHAEKAKPPRPNKLEKELADLQPEIAEVVNRVTAEALKQKAAKIGQIKEITKTPRPAR